MVKHKETKDSNKINESNNPSNNGYRQKEQKNFCKYFRFKTIGFMRNEK